MAELNIQQAYEILLKETGEICSYGHEESNKYFIFSPDKYKTNGCMDGIDYKVDKYSGKVSEYSYLEYLEDTKKYTDETWPVGIKLEQPHIE